MPTPHPVPIFKDNIVWVLELSDHQCVIIDPGESQPVLDFCAQRGWQPCAILITHHHPDHVGGVQELVAKYPMPVYGPSRGPAHCTDIVNDADCISIGKQATELTVLATPGHTLDHLCYWGHGSLFCGDTLFSGGCGRLFEGTAEQLFNSLQRLSTLPDDTLVFCAHEYTIANLNFASTVEPNNHALRKCLARCRALRDRHELTLPSTLAVEKRINPFLRCHEPSILQYLQHKVDPKITTPLQAFTALRKLKDEF
jgi:hydroxyacylglutathione hydrolase